MQKKQSDKELIELRVFKKMILSAIKIAHSENTTIEGVLKVMQEFSEESELLEYEED